MNLKSNARTMNSHLLLKFYFLNIALLSLPVVGQMLPAWQSVQVTNAQLVNKFNLPPTDNGGGLLNFATDNAGNIGGGLGIIQAGNVESPMVWMYNFGGRNAFTVARKNYTTGNPTSSTIDAFNPLFQVRVDGNVGIGTTAPQTLLHIQNSANGWTQTIKGAATSTNDIVGIKFKTGYNGEENLERKWIGIAAVVESIHGDANGLALYTGQTERLRIAHFGNVGIGKTDPKVKLDVLGQGIFSRDGTPAYSDPNYTLAIAENTQTTNKKASISFHNSGQDEGTIELSPTSESGFRALKFYDHQNLGLGLDVRGNIKTSGNIGIGINPLVQVKLHVRETGSSANTWRGRIVAGGDNQAVVLGEYNNQAWLGGHNVGLNQWTNLVIAPGGNVAIGNITPTSKFHLDGNMKINSSNTIEFGAGITKQGDNGKIGYGTFETGSLCIIGAGTATDASDRRITFWNSGGAKFLGKVRIEGNLSVVGEIKTNKVIVTQSVFADYVFEEDYNLKSLNEVESYIKTHKHLPNIPSAKEVKEKGLDTGEMLKLQMEKIEELTLHIIRQQKEIDALKAGR